MAVAMMMTTIAADDDDIATRRPNRREDVIRLDPYSQTHTCSNIQQNISLFFE